MTDHIDALAEKVAREIAEKLYGLHPEIEAEDPETWQKILEAERSRCRTIVAPIIAAAIRSAVEPVDIARRANLREIEALRARVAELEKARDDESAAMNIYHKQATERAEQAEARVKELAGDAARLREQNHEAASRFQIKISELERRLLPDSIEMEDRERVRAFLTLHPNERGKETRDKSLHGYSYHDGTAVFIAFQMHDAAQSRILALEGALRDVVDMAGSDGHFSNCDKKYEGDVEQVKRIAQMSDCPGCKAEQLLTPQPQASGGDSEKCGESAGHLIAGASYFPCGLLKGHEGEHRGSGTCVTHGPYISLQPGMPKCPQWPICIPASGGEEKAK